MKNNIRETVANNIVTLRKQKGMTQLELAEQIMYSDKAISRWEKCEVMPDIETLQNLAQIFDVPLAYMLEEHKDPQKAEGAFSKVAVYSLTISVVWLISTIVYVYTKILYSTELWQIYVWSVPATAFLSLMFDRKWLNKKYHIVLLSIFIWTFIASVYLQLLAYNMWPLFLIGVPLQWIVIVARFLKPRKKDK